MASPKAGFRVLRPQPRGIGQSVAPMRDITLHDFARDIAAVIRHYGGPAVIVGHAYGNWVARMTAVDHPQLVRGVVIAAAASKTVSARAQRGRHQERRHVAAEGGAAQIPARDVLCARQRSRHLARRLACGGERGPASRRARHQAGGMVVGRQRAAARPAGRQRPVSSDRAHERAQGRARRPRQRRGDPQRQPRLAAGAAAAVVDAIVAWVRGL